MRRYSGISVEVSTGRGPYHGRTGCRTEAKVVHGEGWHAFRLDVGCRGWWGQGVSGVRGPGHVWTGAGPRTRVDRCGAKNTCGPVEDWATMVHGGHDSGGLAAGFGVWVTVVLGEG